VIGGSAENFMAKRRADILCIGIDNAAMQTRMLILEREGHKVTQARDLRQVKTACETIAFQIAILGQSLNASEKMRIADVVVTTCKEAKILDLHKGYEPEFSSADAHLQVSAMEPEGLVETVNTLLETPRKKKARSQ
jgi:hypothetical protein